MKHCPRCEEQSTRLYNPFTPEVWQLLIDAGEVSSAMSLCSPCFEELRDTLIEIIK